MRLVVDRKLTPAEIAEAWCELTDEDQAQFFIEAARIAKSWAKDRYSAGATMQWSRIGGHLRTCPCSTHEARMMVADIADACTDQP